MKQHIRKTKQLARAIQDSGVNQKKEFVDNRSDFSLQKKILSDVGMSDIGKSGMQGKFNQPTRPDEANKMKPIPESNALNQPIQAKINEQEWKIIKDFLEKKAKHKIITKAEAKAAPKAPTTASKAKKPDNNQKDMDMPLSMFNAVGKTVVRVIQDSSGYIYIVRSYNEAEKTVNIVCEDSDMLEEEEGNEKTIDKFKNEFSLLPIGEDLATTQDIFDGEIPHMQVFNDTQVIDLMNAGALYFAHYSFDLLKGNQIDNQHFTVENSLVLYLLRLLQKKKDEKSFQTFINTKRNKTKANINIELGEMRIFAFDNFNFRSVEAMQKPKNEVKNFLSTEPAEKQPRKLEASNSCAIDHRFNLNQFWQFVEAIMRAKNVEEKYIDELRSSFEITIARMNFGRDPKEHFTSESLFVNSRLVIEIEKFALLFGTALKGYLEKLPQVLNSLFCTENIVFDELVLKEIEEAPIKHENPNITADYIKKTIELVRRTKKVKNKYTIEYAKGDYEKVLLFLVEYYWPTIRQFMIDLPILVSRHGKIATSLNPDKAKEKDVKKVDSKTKKNKKVYKVEEDRITTPEEKYKEEVRIKRSLFADDLENKRIIWDNITGYNAYPLSAKQQQHLIKHERQLLNTLPDGDCALNAVLESLNITDIYLYDLRQELATNFKASKNYENITDREGIAKKMEQQGWYEGSTYMLDLLAKKLNIKITIIEANDKTSIKNPDGKSEVLIYNTTQGVGGHFYGSKKKGEVIKVKKKGEETHTTDTVENIIIKIKKNERKVILEAQKMNLSIINVQGNGNCFYLALQASGVELSLKTLKENLIIIINNNAENIQEFLTYTTVDELTDNILNGNWNNEGGDVVTQIMASALNRDIRIITPDGVRNIQPNPDYKKETTIPQSSPITVAYNGVNHYMGVKPKK